MDKKVRNVEGTIEWKFSQWNPKGFHHFSCFLTKHPSTLDTYGSPFLFQDQINLIDCNRVLNIENRKGVPIAKKPFSKESTAGTQLDECKAFHKEMGHAKRLSNSKTRFFKTLYLSSALLIFSAIGSVCNSAFCNHMITQDYCNFKALFHAPGKGKGYNVKEIQPRKCIGIQPSHSI
jgi:hypothetical protein